MVIEQEKLERFEREILKPGSHESVEDGFCVMEMVAFLAGEEHSDDPVCASPVISAFLRAWNDTLDDAKRQFLKPYAVRVIGTAAANDIENRRAWLAVDWLIRTYLPTWLELAGLAEEANQIRALPEITIVATLPMLEAVLQITSAALRAARRAATSAALTAAESATIHAPLSAANSAATHAIQSAPSRCAAVLSAVMSVAKHAAISAARSVALSAARSTDFIAALNALSPTAERLMESAVELLDRMIAVTG